MSLPALKPEDAPMTAARPQLISVEAAKQLDAGQVKELFATHINPGQLHFLKLLGFDRILVDRADGMHYVTKDGRRILDFFGGFCSVAFGHNHPRILDVRRRFQEEKRQEIAIAFMSQYAAALAHNIAKCSPGGLDMVFLGSSGSEAMEAAVKLAERAAGLGEGRADVGGGAVAVVGQGLDDDGDAARAVAFVADFVVVLAVGAGGLLDGALDIVLRHRLGLGVLDRQAQTRVHRRVGQARLGGDGDFARQLGEHFRPHGILTALAVHDVFKL